MIRVGVIPEREGEDAEGADAPEDFGAPGAPPPFEVLTLTDALKEKWPTDAHVATYFPSWEDPKAWARTNKPCLSGIRALGRDLLCQVLFVDLDFYGPEGVRQSWTTAGMEQWLEHLDALEELGEEQCPLGSNWAFQYSTRKGYRLGYVLEKPIPVDEAERIHRGIVAELERWGVTGTVRVDHACIPWNTLMRLPRVLRPEGGRSEEDPHFFCFEQDNKLKLGSVMPLGEIAPLVATGPAGGYGPVPDQYEVKKLLEIDSPKTGKPIQTEFYKFAKRMLTGHEDAYPYIFKSPIQTLDTLSVKYGGRNNALPHLAGSVVGQLFDKPDVTPEHIYALCLPVVQMLDHDEDWEGQLWRAICNMWTRDTNRAYEKKQKEEVKKEEIKKESLTKIQQIVKTVRTWCDKVPQDSGEAWAFIRDRLVVYHGKEYYPMMLTGYYTDFPVSKEQIVSRVRELGLGCDDIIPLTEVTEKGLEVTTADDIIRICGTSAGKLGSALGSKGTWIKHMGGPVQELIFKSYSRRDDIVPFFNQDVDDWLHIMFGGDYKRFEEWVVRALAFEDGIVPMLSIVGAPNAGKKLIVRGLLEATTAESTASGEDLVGTFNPGLMSSPFLWVDEGLPGGNFNSNAAEAMRRIIGATSLRVNRKNRAEVNVKNPIRVIATANNYKILNALCGGDDMDPDDQEAVRQRIQHFDINPGTPAWLAAKGGMAFTGKPGTRWISADGVDNSDYVIAKHFLWLYENKNRAALGTRFLVDGHVSQEIMAEVSTQSGSAPLVIETIGKMVESMCSTSKSYSGMTLENGNVYVTTTEVLDQFRLLLQSSTREQLNLKKIGSALKGLVKEKDVSCTLASRKEAGKQRWHNLDLEKILDGNGTRKLPHLADLVHGPPVITIAEVKERVAKAEAAKAPPAGKAAT